MSRVEAADNMDFETYLANYYRQYEELHQLKFGGP